ncbi:MAG: ATP-dependent zinc protease family protein [Lacipirellulaceae bacterium]
MILTLALLAPSLIAHGAAAEDLAGDGGKGAVATKDQSPAKASPIEVADADEAENAEPYGEKRIIGATAHLREASTGLRFLARVDSGAKSCSLHAEEVRIDDPSDKMKKNIGKAVRFRVLDEKGESHWIDAEIAETVTIKTSEARDRRYKVWLSLKHGDFEKRVTVTLNDRSHMEFPLLVGRNFLRGDFVVDVEHDSLD